MPRKTRKRKGKGRKDDVASVMKEVLPEIPAERVAEFEEIIPRRFNFRSQDKKWRREDEFRAYHQNPKNIGLGFPFTAEQVVRYYADGFRNSEVRPDGLEKTLPGTTKEWYMLLPGGGWGNHTHEREGPFSANEIGDSIFTNTKLVDRSIAEENWRPQTLSAYLRGEGRMVDLADGSRPRTTLGFRPAGALHALRTERDKFERGWLRGGKKRKTKRRKRKTRKRKTRKRKGKGRKEDVVKTVLDWKPGFDHPEHSLPGPALDNVLAHLNTVERRERLGEHMPIQPQFILKYPKGLGIEGQDDKPRIDRRTNEVDPASRIHSMVIERPRGPKQNGEFNTKKRIEEDDEDFPRIGQMIFFNIHWSAVNEMRNPSKPNNYLKAGTIERFDRDRDGDLKIFYKIDDMVKWGISGTYEAGSGITISDTKPQITRN